MKAKVFLDTNVLLKGFAALKRDQPLPKYIIATTVERYTFEKCIYEAYMAFRGVGGRKPDEGRGDWAERYLRAETDPSPIGKLTRQIHNGDKTFAFFWINQILEAGVGIDHYEQLVGQFVRPEERETAYADVKRLRQLALDRGRFEHLCDEFRSFLDEYAVKVLPYYKVFDLKRVDCISEGSSISVNAATLDGFARDTVLSSEDFEIVFAALSLPADLFVTDDMRLITCAMSLGLNFPLGPSSFCTGEEYSAKMEYKRQLQTSRKFDADS